LIQDPQQIGVQEEPPTTLLAKHADSGGGAVTNSGGSFIHPGAIATSNSAGLHPYESLHRGQPPLDFSHSSSPSVAGAIPYGAQQPHVSTAAMMMMEFTADGDAHYELDMSHMDSHADLYGHPPHYGSHRKDPSLSQSMDLAMHRHASMNPSMIQVSAAAEMNIFGHSHPSVGPSP
jgi:hypothetical protein